MTRDELIARLDEAVDPERDLDLHIWCVANGVAGIGAMSARVRWLSNDFPYYTASIDAALTLVPADHFWCITMRGCKRGGFDACCLPVGTQMEWHAGTTPAIALCIAALKART